MTVNRENIEKLSNYEVVNECADQYTNIDIELIDSELDRAFAQAKLIKVWFWITMIMFIVEVSIFCFLAICNKFCDRNDDDEFYQRVDSKIEM